MGVGRPQRGPSETPDNKEHAPETTEEVLDKVRMPKEDKIRIEDYLKDVKWEEMPSGDKLETEGYSFMRSTIFHPDEVCDQNKKIQEVNEKNLTVLYLNTFTREGTDFKIGQISTDPDLYALYKK